MENKMSMYNLNALYPGILPSLALKYKGYILVHDGIVSLKLCDVVNCNQTVQPELG